MRPVDSLSVRIFLGSLMFGPAAAALVIGACSPAMKQAEQKALNAADVVCALDALDPGLLPTEIDAAIQAACGASPDVHKILEAHQRVAARAQARLALAPASASAAHSANSAAHSSASAPPVIPLAPSSATPPVCSSASAAPAASASAPPRRHKKKVSP